MKMEVKTLENKAAGDITLDKSIFGIEVRPDVIHQMVVYPIFLWIIVADSVQVL